VFGEDLEPATVSMRWETVLALDNNQPQPPALESSHTTQQPCLTAGVCWKKLIHGGWCATIIIRSPEYPGLDDVREEEYATWQDAGWPD
jgi:hypothetical protein